MTVTEASILVASIGAFASIVGSFIAARGTRAALLQKIEITQAWTHKRLTEHKSQ